MNEQAVDIRHKAFRGSLEGQTVTIPSMYKLLPEWQPNLHEDYERARDETLDPWIRRYFPTVPPILRGCFRLTLILDGFLMSVLRGLSVRPTLVVLLRFGCQILSPTRSFALLPNILPGFVLLSYANQFSLTFPQYFVYDDSMGSIQEA
jgi:hypothetical protein